MDRTGLLGLVFGLFSCSVAQSRTTEIPDNGFVPDEKTAVRIAEAVVAARFGDKTAESERPFKASLANEVWTVVGSFHCPNERGVGVEPHGDFASANEQIFCVGGVASVKISKSDGTILGFQHTE